MAAAQEDSLRKVAPCNVSDHRREGMNDSTSMYEREDVGEGVVC